MLVINRGCQEVIMVGDDIAVRVVSIDDKQVKIGIETPKHVAVHRKEILKLYKERQTKLNQ